MNPSNPDVIVVGCVKRKQRGRHPARDLYASPLWQRRRAYAEQAGVPWFIFSAKHGLIEPTREIESYDVSMADRRPEERTELGRAAARALANALGTLTGKVVEIHAGARYREALEPAVRARGGRVTNPLAGLPLGRQLQWYQAH